MLGLSQQQMAEMIGVTYQQAHKYERGINRISAGRLFEISQVLGVSVGFFYEGLESDSGEELKYRQRMCLEVARNFTQIDNKTHQEPQPSGPRPGCQVTGAPERSNPVP